MKQTTHVNDYAGVASDNMGAGYLTNPQNIPNTHRQFTSDNQYYGVGDSANEKQMLYSDKYNATINEVRDILLKERKPTKTSVKLFNQVDNMNVNHKKI